MTKSEALAVVKDYFTKDGIDEKALTKHNISVSSIYRLVKEHGIEIKSKVSRTVSYVVKE